MGNKQLKISCNAASSALLLGVAALLLIAKLNGMAISWLWVFSPLWIPIMIIVGISLALIILWILAVIIKSFI